MKPQISYHGRVLEPDRGLGGTVNLRTLNLGTGRVGRGR
jgi:hypothetical protein